MRFCKFNIILLLVICVTGCTGCTNQPGAHSSTKWSTDTGESLIIGAKERVIINSIRTDATNKSVRITCAEPVPEVVSSIGTDLGLGASAEQGIIPTGAVKVNRSATELITQVQPKTTSVLLLRDSLYRACEAYANGVIGTDEYRTILRYYDEVLVSLSAIDSLGKHENSKEAVDAIVEITRTYFCLNNKLDFCIIED